MTLINRESEHTGTYGGLPDPAEKTGRVPVTSVAKALFALQHAGLEGRMRITFELFDSDRSGRIDEQELFEILKVRPAGGRALRAFADNLAPGPSTAASQRCDPAAGLPDSGRLARVPSASDFSCFLRGS